MDKPITIPPPVKLEECVIDLDFDVFEWKNSVQSKLFTLGTCRTEKDLVIVMKSYVEAIKKDYFSLVQEAAKIKKFIPRHLLFFRNTLNNIKCITYDNYLDTMEDILAFYINLEIAGVPQKKGNQDKAFKRYLLHSYRQILYVLKLGLMNYEDDRKYHVLMKMDANNNSENMKYYLNFLYRKMLTECPKNKSDLAFCRIYILYQKWKKIRDPAEWPMMDVVMYKMFDKTPQYIENSDVLKKILLCKNNSILNVLNHISNHDVVLTKEYFKYLKTLTYDEEEMMSFDREDSIKKKEVDPYDEEEDTERAYQDYLEWLAKPSEPPEQPVQVLTTNKSSETSTIGEIESDDDDVQFVKAEVLPIICEIPDDDDLCDIVYIDKMPLPIVKKEKEINFLDSIDISEYDKIRDRYRNQRKTVSSEVTLQSSAKTTNISTNTDLREIDSSNNPTVEIPNNDGASATQTKNFVNMETQTETSEFSDKLDFNKNFGGLVTPPGSVSNDTLNLEKEIEQQSQVNVSTSGVTEERQCKASNTVVTTSDESVNCKKEILNSTPNGIRRKTIFQSRDLEDYDNFDPIGEISKNVVKNVETSNTHGSQLPIESTPSPSSTSNLNHLTKCFNESCTSLASPIISSTSIDAQDNLDNLLSNKDGISNNENILESCDSNIDFYSEEYNKSPEEAIHVSQSDLAVDHDSNLDESNQITGRIDENIEETQHSNDLNVANITTDIPVERQLETNKEKVDVPKKKAIEENPRAIYTSERKDIFLNNTIECDPVIQLQAGFQDSDFNNIFSGPVEKLKAPSDYIIPDKSFDLFENKTISKTPNPEISKNVSAVITQNVEISSPTYEGIEEEDVRNFFQKKSYETVPTSTTTTNYNNTKLIKSKCEMLTSTTDEITFNAHNIVDKTVNDTALEKSKDNDFDELKSAKPKKKRILFADEELEVYTPTPPSVLKMNGTLHGILKKTPSLIKKTTRPRVPRKYINLQSFKENHVHPMDIKVQSELYVKVPKISEEELDHFLRLAEAARESQKKVEEQHSRIYMIEYDKNSSNINNSDMVLYRGRNIPLPSITQYRLQTFDEVDQEEGYNPIDMVLADKRFGKRKRGAYPSEDPFKEDSRSKGSKISSRGRPLKAKKNGMRLPPRSYW